LAVRNITLTVSDLLNQAVRSYQAGHLDEAEGVCRAILRVDANHVEALYLLGVVQSRLGRSKEALASYDRVLVIKPNYAQVLTNRGAALWDLKRFEDALASHDKALAIKPDFAEALNNRGVTLQDLERLEDALVSYDKALAIKPDFAEALYGRGLTQHDLKRIEDALVSYDKALAIKPDFAWALYNRGNILRELKRLEDALLSYDKALAIKPDYTEALNNRGVTLQDLKRFDEAMASYDQAIALKPNTADALLNRGLCKLLLGHYQEGWQDYEWRWGARRFLDKRPKINAATWEGEDLAGRRLIVFSEQGLGDTIQFARFLPQLVQRKAKVTFLTQAKLVRVLGPLIKDIDVVSATDDQDAFDFQCALMGLPLRFNTELDTIPAKTPYLSAEPDRMARWKERIGAHGFKIGIGWQGNPNGQDSYKDIPLEEFIPLTRIPQVRLISLQYREGVDQLARLPADVKIETLGDDFDSGPDAFIDTAAVMANLDLIISSCTSIPHLAGALGRPTWVVLKHVPDWRWLLDREDSPWYPTMRLFRQPERDDWTSVFSKIERELRSLLNAKADAIVLRELNRVEETAPTSKCPDT
jgi:tetratricopeptide (TPR) repeat protein